MARLFLSLYLFIAITLIGLSTVLDRVFLNDLTPVSQESEALISMLTQLASSDIELLSFAQQSGFETKEIALNSMAWSQSEKQQLKSGGIISLFDEQLGQQFFVPLSADLLLELTLPGQARQHSPYILYSAIFYLALGAVLVLWVWPLWRDLTRLKKSVSHLNPDGTIDTIKFSRRSLIKPISDAINNLSLQVGQLMLTQRELTGAVAHEIRTPLSRLKFALAIKPDPGTGQWHAMNQDVDELEKLIQEMLSFTSMEVHKPELNMSEIPLLDLCRQLAQKNNTDKQKAQIAIEGDNIVILADEHYLQRAIENLLLNAQRYAEKVILLKIEITKYAVHICVEDDGAGISTSIKEKIFEPFFRPDESRNRRRGGAGLGLAIVKRIMQWHNGKCWVEGSTLGGARFVLKMKTQQISASTNSG